MLSWHTAKSFGLIRMSLSDKWILAMFNMIKTSIYVCVLGLSAILTSVFYCNLLMLFSSFVEADELPPIDRSKNINMITEILDLKGHVEGGFFRRTYESGYTLQLDDPQDSRLSMTSIFYLLSSESPLGQFHSNRSDIIHFFHMGDPIEYYMIDPEGNLTTAVMGHDISSGQVLQLLVPGGTWKASKIDKAGEYGYGLISEAVTPGFVYDDMTLGSRSYLKKLFPQHTELIDDLLP